MTKFLRTLALGALLATTAVLPLRAAMTAEQKAEVEKIVRDYLLKNPEIIQETLVELERRQRDAEVAARTKALQDIAPAIASASNAVIGNPKGDVTVVEFFDYNCGFCKKGLADLQKLVKEDSKLRVVLKDLPILTPGSREAAAVALALKAQVKPEVYWDFHVKLMSKTGQIAKAQAMEAAREVGADLGKIEKEMNGPDVNNALEESRKMADSLGLSGTPSYIIADDVVVGAVGFDQLKGRIDQVRKCGKTQC